MIAGMIGGFGGGVTALLLIVVVVASSYRGPTEAVANLATAGMSARVYH